MILVGFHRIYLGGNQKCKSFKILLNQARASRRPVHARFLKVAVKRIFHGNNCFLNVIETKPFTPLNSRYSLSNLGNR